MNKDYTHITLVVDRSGSMSSCWTDTIGGIQSLIKDQKEDKSKCTFSFYDFDDKITQNLNFVDIQLVSENVEEFGIAPRGWTALYDAIGRAIAETGSALAKLKESDRPGRVIVVIQTDGLENSSREYTSAKIAEMIKTQTETFQWQFQFVGADEKTVLEAQRVLGFSSNNTAFYQTKNSSDTFKTLNSKLKSSRSADFALYSSGATMAFTDEEKVSMAKD